MAEIKKRIYSQWAFQEDWDKKRDRNTLICKELKEKCKARVDYTPQPEEQGKDFDVIIRFSGHGYANTKYEIYKNGPKLSEDELALLCDGGNLCFGYRTEGRNIVIYTD